MKPGDKIVCIDDTNVGNILLYNTYTIYNITDDDQIILAGSGCYRSNRFISTQEYRRLKLKKLNESR